MVQPIHSKNSIEVTVFAIEFAEPFSSAAVVALMALKESMNDEYPVGSQVNSVKMRMEVKKDSEELTSSSDKKVSGIVLQKLDQSRRPTWSLRAENNYIVVSCFDYQDWDSDAQKALSDLITAAAAVVDEKNPLTVISLQVVDRFVGPTLEKYKLNQIFNTKSNFFPKQTAKSGPLWHVHQGWFAPAEIFGGQYLNVLNMSTNDTPNGIITTIDHLIRFQSLPPMAAEKACDGDFLGAIFNDLHRCNKNTINDVLNTKQLKAIGLC